jgi:hypothetical protein
VDRIENRKGEVVISGIAEVMAPTEKIRRERVTLPEVELLEPDQHQPADSRTQPNQARTPGRYTFTCGNHR